MKVKKPFLLVISIFTCQMAGIIGSVFTFNSIATWYINLNKPSFNPPSWVFGPAWTILYTLMGISLYLVVIKTKDIFKSSLIKVFGFHLMLNSLWSIIFFGLKNPGLALLEIMVLWGFILYLVINFYKVDSRAGIILLPYLFWVSFASVLNYSIWILN